MIYADIYEAFHLFPRLYSKCQQDVENLLHDPRIDSPG